MCRSATRIGAPGLLALTALVVSLGMAAGTLTAPTPARAAEAIVALPAVRTATEATPVAKQKAPSLKKSARNVGTVVLSGRTARSRTAVVLQRRTTHQKWARVKVLASRKHRFRTVVWKQANKASYRVVDRSNGRHSRVRAVPRLKAGRDACGPRPLKATGQPWRCSFHDDFAGTTLDTDKWTIQTDGFITGDPPGSAACYRGDNVHVADGTLRLKARRAKLLECPGLIGMVTKLYTSGMVSTHDKWSQRYGRFEARIRNTATTAQGLHESYWLWPADPAVGNIDEIDISETYSRYPEISVPFLHYGDNTSRTGGPHQTTAYDCVAPRGRWTTYRMEWTARRIRIWVDGRLCLSNTSGDAAFSKRFIMIFTQALGSGKNAVNLLDPPKFPATMKVDYARVWK